jgi:hypothetical protein
MRASIHLESTYDIQQIGKLYDKVPPTKFGATTTPSFVIIRCTLFVSGFIQAHSFVSNVTRPKQNKERFTSMIKKQAEQRWKRTNQAE